jgi:hypothetical protein
MRLFLCAVLALVLAGPALAAPPSEKQLQPTDKPMAVEGGKVRPGGSVLELGVGGQNNPPSDPPPKKGTRIAPTLDGVQVRDKGIGQAMPSDPRPPRPDPPGDPDDPDDLEIDNARINRGIDKN